VALEQTGRAEKLELELPREVKLAPIGPDQTLSAMLAAGDLDALITPRTPSCFGKSPRVARLFPDYRAVEHAYFKKSGLFPIMHVLAVRQALLAKHPWLASSLFTAFRRAKDIAIRELEEIGAYNVTMPWLASALADIRAVLGDDYWPYGLAKNRASIEAALRYSHAQGLSARKLTIEQAFVPDLDWAVRV
jgi:4,5-dihydroxyphthalate decarboxylase